MLAHHVDQRRHTPARVPRLNARPHMHTAHHAPPKPAPTHGTPTRRRQSLHADCRRSHHDDGGTYTAVAHTGTTTLEYLAVSKLYSSRLGISPATILIIHVVFFFVVFRAFEPCYPKPAHGERERLLKIVTICLCYCAPPWRKNAKTRSRLCHYSLATVMRRGV